MSDLLAIVSLTGHKSGPCAPSEDSDRPSHPLSLVRIFIGNIGLQFEFIQMSYIEKHAPSKDSDQSAYSYSLIRIFTWCILDSRGCKILTLFCLLLSCRINLLWVCTVCKSALGQHCLQICSGSALFANLLWVSTVCKSALGQHCLQICSGSALFANLLWVCTVYKWQFVRNFGVEIFGHLPYLS